MEFAPRLISGMRGMRSSAKAVAISPSARSCRQRTQPTTQGSHLQMAYSNKTTVGNLFPDNLKSEDEFAVVLLVCADVANKSLGASLHHQPADGAVRKQPLKCKARSAISWALPTFSQGCGHSPMAAQSCHLFSLHTMKLHVESQQSMLPTYQSPPLVAALDARMAAGAHATAAMGSF